MDWSISYKFIGMCYCQIYGHSRLLDYLIEHPNSKWDFDNCLPFFREVYVKNQVKIDPLWLKEFHVWPFRPSGPSIPYTPVIPDVVVRTVLTGAEQDSGGYVIKPDAIVLDWSSVRSLNSKLEIETGLNDQLINHEHRNIEVPVEGGITRRQVNALLEGLQATFRMIKSRPEAAHSYMDDPRNFLIKYSRGDLPLAKMEVALGSSEIVYSYVNGEWNITLPTEPEGYELSTERNACGQSCNVMTLLSLKNWAERQA